MTLSLTDRIVFHVDVAMTKFTISGHVFFGTDLILGTLAHSAEGCLSLKEFEAKI